MYETIALFRFGFWFGVWSGKACLTGSVLRRRIVLEGAESKADATEAAWG